MLTRLFAFLVLSSQRILQIVGKERDKNIGELLPMTDQNGEAGAEHTRLLMRMWRGYRLR